MIWAKVFQISAAGEWSPLDASVAFVNKRIKSWLPCRQPSFGTVSFQNSQDRRSHIQLKHRAGHRKQGLQHCDHKYHRTLPERFPYHKQAVAEHSIFCGRPGPAQVRPAGRIAHPFPGSHLFLCSPFCDKVFPSSSTIAQKIPGHAFRGRNT